MSFLLQLAASIASFSLVVSCKPVRPVATEDSSVHAVPGTSDMEKSAPGSDIVKVASRVVLKGMSVVYYGDFSDEQDAGRHNTGSRQLFWDKHPKWSYESLNSTYCQYGIRKTDGQEIQDYALEPGDRFRVAKVVHDNNLKSISGRDLSCGFQIQLNDTLNEQNYFFIECSSFSDEVCALSDVTNKGRIAEFIGQSKSFQQSDRQPAAPIEWPSSGD